MKYPYIREPSILVLDEKHGHRYFVVKNDDDLHAASLHIVRERAKESLWYPTKEELGTRPPDLEFPELPYSLFAEANRQKAERVREQRAWDEEQAVADMVEQALRDRNGFLAWRVMQARRDHEYEGFDIVPIEQVERGA